MSRLRMQIFPIIGQGVPEISVRTDKHTDLRIYYIEVKHTSTDRALKSAAEYPGIML